MIGLSVGLQAGPRRRFLSITPESSTIEAPFPLLSRLQTRHRRSGLSVLGVSTDFQKEKAAVEKFLVEQKPSFPNYRKKSGGDDQEFIEAVDSSWGGELPFSVLYDRSGRKVRVFSGELEIAAVEKQIVSLLAARAPAAAR